MIIIGYDNSSRSFSIIDDLNLLRSANSFENRVLGNHKKSTFLGKFTGKNKRLEKQEQEKHQQRMAMIASGKDPNSVNSSDHITKKINK